jgi:dipeptidyl aminopeptidase
MSSKVVEADAGIHSLAIAVAVGTRAAPPDDLLMSRSFQPVTSWRLYGKPKMFLNLWRKSRIGLCLDSIYTERYMNLPRLNPGGYINASISNVTGFHKVDYLLMHGSGDDNVHFANSAHLLDMLTEAHVRNFRFRMFTDR